MQKIFEKTVKPPPDVSISGVPLVTVEKETLVQNILIGYKCRNCGFFAPTTEPKDGTGPILSTGRKKPNDAYGVCPGCGANKGPGGFHPVYKQGEAQA